MTEHSGNEVSSYPFQKPQGYDQAHEGQENMAWDIKRSAYIWEDPASGVVYTWDSEKEQWVLDESTLESQFEETLGKNNSPYNPEGESYDPALGSEDVTEEKKPSPTQEKSNQDTEDTKPPTTETEVKDDKKKKRKRKPKKKPNCTLYVTGLPRDVTEDEFLNFFKTAGIIAKDPINLQPMIRIYRDDNGVPKGDGRVTFLKVLSIPNAFQLLDGFDFRPPEGHIIKLEIAKFENKEGKPTRPAPSKKQRRYNQEANELGWDEKEKRHVIIKHMFDAYEASKDPNFYENLRVEIESEFNKIGSVEALKIFERNPQGIIAVKYDYEIDAQRCIDKMNGRWFDGC